MIGDVMSIITKVYFPVLMPFLLILMSVLLSDHIVAALQQTMGVKGRD